MDETRNAALDRLAMGSKCPECGAWPDEPCVTRRAMRPTAPHSRRIDRACEGWQAVEAMRTRIDVREMSHTTVWEGATAMDAQKWLARITEHSGMGRDEVVEAAQYGADTGWPGFTYTSDAAAFTAKYRDDVWAMLAEDAEDYGAKNVADFVGGFARADMTDSPDRFDNLLAWYVLESVGRALEDEGDAS